MNDLKKLKAKIEARKKEIIKGKTPWSSSRCIDKLEELDLMLSELEKVEKHE